MTLPDSARAVVQSNAIAHLVTLRADGSARVTAAWVGLDGDEVVIATLFDQPKLRDVRRDPRVSLSMETGRVAPSGLAEFLVLEGRARLTEGGAPELLQELAYTYLGPDVTFPPMPDPPPGFVMRIAVDRVRGVGPWAE